MGTTRRFCKSVLRQLILIPVTVLITILLILFLILVQIPVLVYRQVVQLAAKCFRPDLAKLVHPRSAIAATDDLYERPTLTLLVVNTVQGDVSPEDLAGMRTQVVATLINKKNERGSGLQYPELQQCYEHWGGFIFWKWVDKFDINNHMNIHPESETRPFNEVDVAKLRLQLVRKPFVRDQSPWELVIVRNYKPTNDATPEVRKCVFISRAHHGLCDGYSMLKGFMEHAVMTELGKKAMADAIPKPKYEPRNWLQIGFHFACAFVCAPYHIAQQLVTEYSTRQNQLQAPHAKDLSRQVYPAATRVPMGAINTIRKAYSVTFTSVILAGLAGGLRKFMKDNEMRVPKYVYVITPLPWPNHPEGKLINYWTYAIVSLPLGLKSAEERLRFTHAHWEAIKYSTGPTLNFYLVPLVGSLTVGWMKFFGQIKNSNATLILSNFPGPPAGTDFLGYPILEASFGGGLGPGNLGMGMAMMSNSGILSMNIGVDHSILGAQPQVQELIDNISAEITMLSQDSSV